MKSGDIHIYPGPTDNPCHICNNEVDTQHHLQCDTCDTWLHTVCVNVNQQELSAYETFDIPFTCPRCEWDKNDLKDINFDVFNGSNRYSNISIDSDLQTVLDPPTSTGFSFAHINVNGIDVDGRIYELRYLFQNKTFDVIGINETKLTENMATSNFKIGGYEMFRADRIKRGKKTDGGCALYVRENVTFEQKPALIPEDLEGICGFVTFLNKHKMEVANIYRHPKQKINWFDKTI